MQFDMQNPTAAGEVMSFPDWPFAAVPLAQVRETVRIGGSSSTVRPAVRGEADKS